MLTPVWCLLFFAVLPKVYCLLLKCEPFDNLQSLSGLSD